MGLGWDVSLPLGRRPPIADGRSQRLAAPVIILISGMNMSMNVEKRIMMQDEIVGPAGQQYHVAHMLGKGAFEEAASSCGKGVRNRPGWAAIISSFQGFEVDLGDEFRYTTLTPVFCRGFEGCLWRCFTRRGREAMQESGRDITSVR